MRSLGPVLGAYHPLVEDNVTRLKQISGQEEVSFHMSGTEAIMQAVRLARYHTRRSHLVRFCGAYHGWWDDVQPGIGNPTAVHATYTLKDMDQDSIRVLESRHDIACVLVNPLQVLHPNAGAPADGTLVDSSRRAGVDREAYAAWLRELRDICTRRGIVLIFDEIFVGFRLARGGAQEYFGVSADLVTYGKTVGGGLPIGVLCGRARYMKRFSDDRPSDFCFARGTFNSHPYVMGAMHEFLRRLDEPLCESRIGNSMRPGTSALGHSTPGSSTNICRCESPTWCRSGRSATRHRPATTGCSRYHLRAEGLYLSWIGTGRLIFSHTYTDVDVAAVRDRFVAAARAMCDDGWWWQAPELTDRSIRARILRDTLAARFPILTRRPAHAASSETIGSKSSPRMT